MVGGNYLTAVRTAAASSISIKHLSRPESKVLGMIGAGFQSAFQMRAALEQREFEKVIGWNLHPEMLSRLDETAREAGLPFEAVDLDRLGAEADVINFHHVKLRPHYHVCSGERWNASCLHGKRIQPGNRR